VRVDQTPDTGVEPVEVVAPPQPQLLEVWVPVASPPFDEDWLE
jgi:hypothetical protein